MSIHQENGNYTLPNMKGKLKEIISQFADKRQMDVGEFEDGFVLDVPIEYESTKGEVLGEKEIRHQFIFITYNRKTPDGKDIYQIFTVCALEETRFYRNALFLNANLPFGAFAIAQVETVARDLKRELVCLPTGGVRIAEVTKQNCFVLVDTYLVSEADSVQMEASVVTVARAGDKLEKMLMKEDIR